MGRGKGKVYCIFFRNVYILSRFNNVKKKHEARLYYNKLQQFERCDTNI